MAFLALSTVVYDCGVLHAHDYQNIIKRTNLSKYYIKNSILEMHDVS